MAYFRHPRGYDGAQLTSHSLGPLLDHALDKLQRNFARGPQEVLAFWPKLVGPQMAAFAKATRFQEGVLHVTVSNSTVYSMLATQEKAGLISQIASELPASGVRNIVFRLG